VAVRRILGIDPGSRITGYGIVDSDGVRSGHVASGCIRLGDGAMADRLGAIFAAVQDLVRQFEPRELAVEQVFVARNAAAALKLGQARGAAICAAVSAGMTVSEYAPRAIKQAVVGTGRAEKPQVQHMVRLILGLDAEPAEDAADALAVALAHAHTDATLRQLPGRGRGGTR
jgi:crossover junction endodeoxyribonuclease RuvC